MPNEVPEHSSRSAPYVTEREEINQLIVNLLVVYDHVPGSRVHALDEGGRTDQNIHLSLIEEADHDPLQTPRQRTCMDRNASP